MLWGEVVPVVRLGSVVMVFHGGEIAICGTVRERRPRGGFVPERGVGLQRNFDVDFAVFLLCYGFITLNIIAV